jgi:L-threonylcarbamoyladenylate synthase
MLEIIHELNEASLKKIVKVIDNGGVIAFPTETVYALAADASNFNAVAKIYKLKNRFENKPLPILVGDIYQANRVVEFNKQAQELALRFFPGPLTIVLKSKIRGNLASNINQDIGTIGIRMPNNISALKILKAVGRPLVGTSANISNQKSAINAAEVIQAFSDRIDLLIDQGTTEIGIPSTIIDLSGAQAKLLREGTITRERIVAILGEEII